MYGINILLGYIDSDKDQCPIKVTENKDSLTRSIINDVADIFNTKIEYLYEDGITLISDYGLPDLKYYSPYSNLDKEEVANYVKKSLSMFEPRLTNVIVEVSTKDTKHGCVFHIKIKARINLQKGNFALILSVVNHNTMGSTISHKMID